MENLKTEYVDIKDITHKVEHFTAVPEDDANKQRITEDLLKALTRGKRHMAA